MPKKKLVIALAGNANVGKSVIFNHLTGLHQHIGNWPGKTVERAEGTLHFKGYTIDVVDLPRSRDVRQHTRLARFDAYAIGVFAGLIPA